MKLKKVFCLIFLLSLMSVFVACSSGGDSSKTSNDSSVVDQNDGDAPDDTTEPEDNTESNVSQSDISVDEQVLLDQNGVKITLTALDFDGFWGPELKVLIENDSDSSITVQTRDTVVNGFMIDATMSANVEPGKKSNDSITFMSSDFKTANIELIKDVELKFHVVDGSSWNTLFDSEPIVINTSADPSYVQPYDDGGTVLLDQQGFKIVAKQLDSEDSFWGTDLYLYVENNSGQDATIQLRDTSINGFMVDPIFSCDILDGKKAYDSITFFESDLTDNGIDVIEGIEFSFHIFSFDNWETIYDSEPVSVSF